MELVRRREHAKGFTEVKNHLIEAPVLVHYTTLNYIICQTGSQWQVMLLLCHRSCLIAHVDVNGQEYPVAILTMKVD